jgi:UDPglucose 6-dehydrogenase
MRIAMIGTGYVGLVSGACFSDFGHVVTCVDRDAAKIRELQNGKIPIFEPGLDALVANNVEAGRLSFATESAAAIRAADAIFLAVGTPSRRGDGFADLSYIYDAAREIAAEMEGFIVIVIKSTVPVGTMMRLTPSSVSCAPMQTSPSCRTRSFCARARQLTISSAPIASWLAPMTSGHAA